MQLYYCYIVIASVAWQSQPFYEIAQPVPSKAKESSSSLAMTRHISSTLLAMTILYEINLSSF